MIRTRFAPSPTGYLHIGGVRTALFNFLYCRSQQGEFLLRIEDTDRERSRKEYEDAIVDSMRWLGLQWDGTLIYQSQRLSHYQELAKRLISQNLAYEETESGKTAVKFKMPKKNAKFYDLVKGEITFDSSLFDDLVILKSDGFPTYHFACVVDDHDMEITHVIRGEDHLSNTPRQRFLFEALGWKPPKYAHLPLILGNDGTPLSKRHGAVSLSHFREEGYLPAAILNYLALLGWGPEGNEEFFTLDALIKKFSLKRITKAGARFNPEKLQWINAQHIKKMPEDNYLSEISQYHRDLASRYDPVLWRSLVLMYKTRLKTWKDLLEQADYFFQDQVRYDPLTFQAIHSGELVKMLEDWMGQAAIVKDFEDEKKLEEMTRSVAKLNGKEAKDIIHPLRFALTSKTVSPGLFEVMRVLGKQRCLDRITAFKQKEVQYA